MKIEKKDMLFWTLIAIVVIALTVMLISNKNNKGLTTVSPSPSNSPAETSAITTASPTTAPTVKTNSQKPSLIAKEVQDYNYWFAKLDYRNMVLGIYGECTYMVPSNLTYKNNTMVMLDNTRSTKDHVLKIGSNEYALKAGEWRLTTLSSPTLPVKMQTFCEGIELGQIDLE